MSHSAVSDHSYSSPLMNRRPTSFDSYYDETDSSDRSEVSDVFADIEIAIPSYRSDESYASYESDSHDESSSFDEQEMDEYSERSDEVSDIFAELYQEFTNASCSNYKDSEGYDYEDSKMEDDDDWSELPAERGYY